MRDIIPEALTSAPLVAAATDGNILYCNDAAHKICAALVCGNDIFTLFPRLGEKYQAARSAGARSFLLDDPGALVGRITVDLSAVDSDGVIFVSPSAGDGGCGKRLMYEDVAREFALTAAELERPQRVTELYDALLSSGTEFLRGRAVVSRRFLPLISSFFDSALPQMYHIGHELILDIGDDVDDGSLIRADVYAFHLTLSALAAAAGYAARGAVTVSASHTGDLAVVTVSADMRDGIKIDGTASFGPHAPDVIFARSLAHASGSEITLDTSDGRVVFTLRTRADDYYPSWLKDEVGESFFLDSCAEIAAEIIVI